MNTNSAKYNSTKVNNFNSNIHLKSESNQNFHVNTNVIDTVITDYKFDSLSKVNNQNFKNNFNKSKFNWQLNEFEHG